MIQSGRIGLPVLTATLAAITWGLWWIPIRTLGAMGLDGVWAGTAMGVGAVLVFFAWARIISAPLITDLRSTVGAALVGVSFALFSAALNETDVVRATLLFYLSPAWSKIIEWVFLGRRWHPISTITLALAVFGAFLVTGGSVRLDNFGVGDTLALLSGVAWAVAAAMVFSGKAPSSISLSFWAAAAGVLCGIAFGVPNGLPELQSTVLSIALISLGLGAVFVTPMLALTLWSAERLPPALLTFLLTAEILTGVGSSVIFLDETFGILQGLGTAIIILAVVSELFIARNSPR